MKEILDLLGNEMVSKAQSDPAFAQSVMDTGYEIGFGQHAGSLQGIAKSTLGNQASGSSQRQTLLGN